MDLYKLVLGIPNGSLLKPTLSLLEKIGKTIYSDERVFEVDVGDSGIISKIKFFRPQDIPIAVKRGKVDIGFCGWDCVKELKMSRKVYKIIDLNYSKKSKKPVKVVLFCKEGSEVDPDVVKKKEIKCRIGYIVDNKDITVSSEYLNLTKPFFKKATISFSHGTTEAKVADELYDYGVGVTETGESLEKNGLKIVKEILISPTVLIARKKTDDIVLFGQLLKGALNAEEYQLVKMNVSAKIKDKVIEAIPSLLSPTVNPTVNRLARDAYAIETVAPTSEVANLTVKLRKLGATGILVMDINIIM